MEPAVDRREHPNPPVIADLTASPQWSPPLIGGSTFTTSGVVPAVSPPQWSPPLIGGSTTISHDPAFTEAVAAMEPAVDRREHRRAATGHGAGPPAAMEPAVDRREHDGRFPAESTG